MDTTWLYRGYIRPKYRLYKVMGLAIPSKGPSSHPLICVLHEGKHKGLWVLT